MRHQFVSLFVNLILAGLFTQSAQGIGVLMQKMTPYCFRIQPKNNKAKLTV